jgi:transcriptional regulator with PAS, ATPase and Fis domain
MAHHPLRPLMGWSDGMEELRGEIDSTARTNMPVMILGERGTGKELVAREIHMRSNRSSGPYVRVNCASLPETLVESELFGCEKSAFTGAERRQGRFEQAHRGTLLLDEIGELSLLAQPKLLRVLETHEVDRVGGQKPVEVDFRLIVSTNRNLEEMARSGKFREDLYDRLNVDIIRIPPLRERLSDIPCLADYFIGVYVSEAKRAVTGVAGDVLDLFQRYVWPGNIRELENVIRRAVFKGRTELIKMEDLPDNFAQNAVASALKPGNYHEQMRAHSHQLLLAALTHCQGNRTKAAKLLGLSRTKFYRLAKLHGLDGGRDGNAGEETEWLQ